RTNTLDTRIEPDGNRWLIGRDGSAPLEADAVVVATGGLSVPKSGSDGMLLPVLAGLGHTIHAPYPPLTPVTPPASVFTGLAGLSLPVALTARADGVAAAARGGFLFTHR